MNIPGPAGSLEAWLERPTTPSPGLSRAAVLCHPHPLYGGTMHDGVLDVVAQTLLSAGISCLRFNFRGTGASTGSHSGGPGEREDLGAAIAWVRAELVPQAVWLAGYSFGASVVWDYLVAQDSPSEGIERALLIAPPNGAMSFAPGDPGCPVDAVAGSADHFVDTEALTGLTAVTRHILSGADHFFSADSRTLAQTLTRLITG